MKRAVVLLRNYAKLPIPDLLSLARRVHDGSIYTDTGRFPAVPTDQKDLGSLTEDLQKKYDAARGRDSVAIAQQDLADKLLLRAIDDIARYAAPLVYNDKAAIEETGFEASNDQTRTTTAPGQLAFMPEVLPGGGIRLNLGEKGTADSFTVIIIEAGKHIDIEVRADSVSISGPAWIHSDTHAKMTIVSVPRRTTLLVYAFAANAAGTGPLSAAMEVTTQ